MNKFSDVPVEDDTVILTEKHIKLDGRDALLQDWRWDGINANSLIFHLEDVSGLSDDEIKSILVQSGFDGCLGTSTISRTDCYVFLNFNFRY